MFKFRCLFSVVIGLAAAMGSSAQQRVVLVSGADSPSGVVTILTPPDLAISDEVNVAPGAFAALMLPDGSHLYVLSKSNGGTWLTIADPGTYAEPMLLGESAASAQITPDGKFLLVLSRDRLLVYEISGGVVRFITALAAGYNPTDLAISQDSRRAFILNSGEQRLIGVDLAGTSGPFDIQVPATATSVTVGPNGLVYVSAERKVLEIDGGSYGEEMIARKALNLSAGFRALKPEFTPDGHRLIVGNLAFSGPVAAVYDLETGAIDYAPSIGCAVQQLFVPDDSLVYVLASDKRLHGLSLSDLATFEPRFGFSSLIRSAAMSNEATRASSLYVVTYEPDDMQKLTRVDLGSRVKAETAGVGGNVLYASAGVTGVAATAIGVTQPQTVAPGSRIAPLVVRAIDSAGRALMGRPVSWSADSRLTGLSAMTETNAAGYAQAIFTAPQQDGLYAATAMVDGISVEFTIAVSSSAASSAGLFIIGGQGQVASLGAYPSAAMTVEARDSAGKPVPDATVTWTLDSLQSGQVFFAAAGRSTCSFISGDFTCKTDDSGKSAVLFRATQIPPNVDHSQFRLVASSEYGEAVFYLTILASGVNIQASLETPASGATLSVPLAGKLPEAISVRVKTTNGYAIENVGVTVAALGSERVVQCAGGVALTDPGGLARCDLVAAGTLGETALEIEVGGRLKLTGLQARITPAMPSLIAIMAGDHQYGNTGTALADPLVAKVEDASGNPLPGATATWEVIPAGAATLAPASSTSDASGLVSTRVTLGPTPGQFTIRVKAGTGQVDFAATAVMSGATFTRESGSDQTVAAGGTFAPLVVKVAAAGAALPNIPVTFAIASGSATLSATDVMTGADGKASVVVTAGDTPGPVTVTASTPGMEPLTFNLQVRAPGPVLTAESFLNGASFRPGIAAGAIISIVTDGLLDGVPSMPVDTCISPGNVIGPLPLRLAGVEVQFSDRMAPVFAVCRTAPDRHQINVQAPFELAPATIDAVVRTGAGTDSAKEVTVNGIQVLSADPGIFQTVAEGQTIAVAFRPDGSLVTPSNPAHAGETIRIYATGLGPVVPSVGTNQTGLPDQAPEYAPVVQVGGTGAAPVTGKYAENMIGVFTVTFVMPTVSGNVEIRLDMVRNGDQLITGSTATIPVQ